METEADSKLRVARENVRSALLALNAIVVEQCWGHDEFSAERIKAIKEAHLDLIRIRDNL